MRPLLIILFLILNTLGGSAIVKAQDKGMNISTLQLSLANKNTDPISHKKTSTSDKEILSFSGNASWYGAPFHGKKTASGEIFDMYKLSAAHKTLPLPSFVIVEDPHTGNTVLVKVNDRGPYAPNRVLDLSREAARRLGTLSHGVTYVDATVIKK